MKKGTKVEEKDWLSEMTGETPKPIITSSFGSSLVKTSAVDKPRITITTPAKKIEIKPPRITIPLTPSTSAPLQITPKLKLKVQKQDTQINILDSPKKNAVLQEVYSPSKVKLKIPATPNIIPIKLSLPGKVETEENGKTNGQSELKINLLPKTPNVIKVKAPAKPETELEFCKRILEKLRENKLATYFNEPVDPIKLNIPIYLDIIKHPMDFGTVDRKLKEEEYKNADEFQNDVLLVFRNCFTFNFMESEVYKAGRKLQQIFLKEMQHKPMKLFSIKRTDAKGIEICQDILEDLMNHPLAVSFLDPVDYVGLQLPKYPDIVLKPMDLTTIKSKLDNSGYKSMETVLTDISQVFKNCMDFNMEGSTIYDHAVELKKYFEEIWAEKATSVIELQKNLSISDVFIEILETLRNHEYSVPFLHPVDYISLNLPSYPKIIKHPMDFSKIESNINEERYPNPSSFVDDVTLVFRNCYTFNGPTAPISLAARVLEEMFVNEFNGYFPDIPISLSEMKKKK